MKLYIFHIDYGQVGYDLLGMKTGAAKIIIQEFQNLAGYNKRLEFLNSGMVVTYVMNDSDLRQNQTLQKLTRKVDRSAR